MAMIQRDALVRGSAASGNVPFEKKGGQWRKAQKKKPREACKVAAVEPVSENPFRSSETLWALLEKRSGATGVDWDGAVR